MKQPSITCLLVDDDVDEHEIFHLALHALTSDAELRSAMDAQAAMQQLHGSGLRLPDYIFLDLNMPRLDGMELLRMIKQEASAVQAIPVIMYSTSSSQRDIDRCLAAGADRFVTKPGTLTELKEILNNIFGRL
ncbi:response regulator [Chitinophaga pendula]|uniref:response regulator n=1 Tax=Chitinophaga TaxID=79328 RepID=UPI0012FE456D|nr:MULTISPECIES: response regulator [Chitinophaga]UCJ10042.1 response regulator [Chitinophaga pendula]